MALLYIKGQTTLLVGKTNGLLYIKGQTTLLVGKMNGLIIGLKGLDVP